MKRMCVVFFVLATLGCARAAGVPEFSESKVAVLKNGEVFKVIYQGPVEALVRVSILNAEDQVIFAEKIISHGNFLRPYNFKQLPKGDYRICVDDQSGQHVEKICNTDAKGVYPDDLILESGLTAHVMKLKGEDGKYMVSIPQQGKEDVEIRVYDQYNELVFTENQKLDQDFAKIYVLKNLEGATIGVAQSGKEKLFSVD